MSTNQIFMNYQESIKSTPCDSFNQLYIIHYLFASFVFTIYAAQVCPLLESQTSIQLLLPLLISLFIRQFLSQKILQKPYEFQTLQFFYMDMLLFLGAGLLLASYNTVIHMAPWHSNLKVMIGMAILGLFVAIDLALNHERKISETLIREQLALDLSQHFSSFIKKFNAMAILLICSTSLILFLVINKDLDWLLTQGTDISSEFARKNILTEVAFVMLLLLLYCIRIIHTYAKNLNLVISYQNSVLNAVINGDLTPRVPVVSFDEFGIMARDTNAMIDSLQKHQNELKLTRDVSILALASLAETRDNETGAHILRTQRYIKILALHLCTDTAFKTQLTPEKIELLYLSAPLHDIGKVGIPDNILLKPGKLTPDEFEIMKTHAQIGADSLEIAESTLGSNSFLNYAREIAAFHHEKWDGSGYPQGLKGEEIPLSARLMALADVYDALISKRVYKPAFSHDKAKSIIIEGDGKHFDPRVVKAFIESEQAFIDIAQQFRDAE